MKTHNSIQRILAVAFVLFALLSTASADWTTYDCSVTPEDYGFNPGGATGDSYIFQGTTEITDGILDMRSSGPDRYYWKNTLSFEDKIIPATGFTYAFRMKAETTDSSKVAEVQLYTGTYYDKVYFKKDEIDTDKADVTKDYPEGFDVTAFHIYRLTYKDDSLSIFIDDVFFVGLPFATSKGDDAKFVFGDPSSSSSYAASYDWIVWDEAGAIAPGSTPDYPSDLNIEPLVKEEVGTGDWSIYSADETFVDYGFSAGSSSEFGGDVNVIADADNAGNNFVELIGPDTLKNYWKYYLEDSAAIADQGVTIITRMKAENDSSYMTAIQITTGEFYAKVYVKADGDIKVEGDDNYETGLDFSDFHIFRVTILGSTLNLWIDDVKYSNNATVSSTSANSPSFRIGDASTSDAYSAVIDWIIWDETAAYAPGEGSDYPSSIIISPLSGGEVVIPDALYFDETTIAAPQDGGTVEAGLEANTDWTLEWDGTWITSITPLAGDSGVATFTITAEENTGAAPRTATIYGMIGEDEMDVLTITQEGLAVQIDALGASASSAQLKDGAYKDASYAIDGLNPTVWVPEGSIVNGSSEWVKVSVASGSEVVMVKITEYKNSQRLTCFSVDYWDGSAYVEILAKQLSAEQVSDTMAMAFAFPNSIVTDTIKFNFYGNAALDVTDPALAEGWLSISELTIWGEAASSAIRDYAEVSYNVYPNPSTGVFTIENAMGANVKVVSLAGQVIFQKSSISAQEKIDLDLNSGIYLLSVDDAVSKIVIE